MSSTSAGSSQPSKSTVEGESDAAGCTTGFAVACEVGAPVCEGASLLVVAFVAPSGPVVEAGSPDGPLIDAGGATGAALSPVHPQVKTSKAQPAQPSR